MQNRRNDEKTSLERSHSVLSNTKLTILCIGGAIAFTAFFGALAFAEELISVSTILYPAVMIGGLALGALVLSLLLRFRR